MGVLIGLCDLRVGCGLHGNERDGNTVALLLR